MKSLGRSRGAIAAIAAIGWIGVAGNAAAESSLRLPYPDSFGSIPASTYDADYHRVGDAHVVLENVDDSRVRIIVASGIDGGARTVATAELAIVGQGEDEYLRLLHEESRSFDPDGVAMGVLSIDHERGVASCNTPTGDTVKVEEIDLPHEDRVANVPLALLFQPLVEGSTDELTFQFLLCRFGARIIDIDARVASRAMDGDTGKGIVEVEYRPDFGSFVSAVAKKWLPRLSIWFDSGHPGAWVAHRVPLYSKGPEVFVIRDGVSRSFLTGAH